MSGKFPERNCFPRLAWAISKVVSIYVTSPCAEDSHNIAIELYDTLVKNVVIVQRSPLKAVSMVRFVLGLQLCISIVCYNPYISKWSRGRT